MRKYLPVLIAGCFMALVLTGLLIFALTASAKEPDARQLAAQDLPRVLQVIEDTKPAHDRYENALLYKARLLACIDRGECEGTQASVPLAAGQQ